MCYFSSHFLHLKRYSKVCIHNNIEFKEIIGYDGNLCYRKIFYTYYSAFIKVIWYEELLPYLYHITKMLCVLTYFNSEA